MFSRNRDSTWFLVWTLLFLFIIGMLTSCRDDEEIPDPLERYKEEVFLNHVKTNDLTYGENTSILGNFKELKLDLYEPEGDLLENRPLVLLAHSGFFTTGSKDEFSEFCSKLARLGYVAASIEYRVWEAGIPVDSVDLATVALQAMGDMKAAIRFFKKDAATANIYRIDPDRISIGGYSSGAMAALLAAYLNDSSELTGYLADSLATNGGVNGNSGNPGYSTNVRAVISIAGGLFNKNLINVGEPMLLSIHGEADEVMPYCVGTFNDQLGNPAFYLEGPCSYHHRALDWGITNELLILDNGNHNSPFSNEWRSTVEQKIIDFLFLNVI